MKKLFALIVASIVSLVIVSSVVMAWTFVNGYTKSNGTVVEGHWRSTPSERFDVRGNWKGY